jgi:hypothetical protein
MNEAASSVEPKDKTRFATVDDAAFERPQMQFPVFNNCSNITNIWVRTNCDMRCISLTRKIARWTCGSVRGSNEPSKPIRIKKIHNHLIMSDFINI